MSTSRLGWAEDLDRYWSEDLLQEASDRVSVETQKEANAPTLSTVQEYPYKGQRIITGELEYGIPGRKEEYVFRTAEFEYRVGSGLFLINTSIDRVDPEDIITEINKALSNDSRISSTIQLNRESFWEFLNRATSIERLRLEDGDKVYDASDLLKILRADDPEKKLGEIEKKREDSVTVLRELASKIDTDGRVQSLHDLDLDLYTIDVDIAEATFWHGDDPATLTYDNGFLWVDADEDSAREYIIQLFERDVVHPSYDE